MTTRAVPLRLRYREVPRLPRLAWVATIDRAAGDVLVFHGSAVECREEWMVEGVWDAEFRSGGFHESPHFFGSGLRLADGCLYRSEERRVGKECRSRVAPSQWRRRG